MEVWFMKLLSVIGTAGLFLLLSSGVAAQERPEGDAKPEAKPEGKAEAKPEAKKQEEGKPEAKKQEEGKPEAKPEAKAEVRPEAKAGKQEEKPAEKQPQAKNNGENSGGGAHGKISEAHYSASFGSGHHFHVNQGDYNNHRFAYGGYSFGFIDPWPVGWYYTDDVYVVYEDGGYYMYDVVHPGIHISVNIL
jgi:hypothetical protein